MSTVVALWILTGISIGAFARWLVDTNRLQIRISGLQTELTQANRKIVDLSADNAQCAELIESQRQTIADRSEEVMQLRIIESKRMQIEKLQKENLDSAKEALESIQACVESSLDTLRT